MSNVNQILKASGLTKEQIDYAKVLMRLGRTISQAIEEAKAAGLE